MDAEKELSATSDDSSLVTIHGFQVQSYGERISPSFKKGLRRLAERGFADPNCVVVKTQSGNRSGITHAGGRYVHRNNVHSAEVMREMRALGMEPPSLPFLVAPGEATLYHEWGHHVDRTWSGDDQDVGFSFRWFSRFYQLGERALRGFPTDITDVRPLESIADAANAVLVWWQASSELFANLFEDWMRGDKKVGWDECEPESLARFVRQLHPSIRITLLPEAGVETVRAETNRLFTNGIQRAVDIPPVRPGLFGDNMDNIVDHLRTVMETLRSEQR